jgi:hypothetical protein
MRNRAIAVLTVVAVIAAGVYIWVQATYVLPAASCGLWGMPGQPPGTPGAAQCFTTASRTCAGASVRVHWQGVESGADDVYVIRAGGTPGRCQVTAYSQVRSIGFPGQVQTMACHASVTDAGVTISCPPVPTALTIRPEPSR